MVNLSYLWENKNYVLCTAGYPCLTLEIQILLHQEINPTELREIGNAHCQDAARYWAGLFTVQLAFGNLKGNVDNMINTSF